LARVDASDTLAYVIAHESGHLLSPDSHSSTSLMRADIDPELIAHNRVSFLAEEAARIRATLSELAERPVPEHPR
jgi:hypothetical protein